MEGSRGLFNDWFGDPASIPQPESHVRAAYHFLINEVSHRAMHPSQEAPPEGLDQVESAMHFWGQSDNSNIQLLVGKMRVAAGKLALFELAPHCKKLRALLEPGKEVELEKVGISAKSLTTLARFRRDPTINLQHEDMLEVYAAAELLEMTSLLPDIFKRLNSLFARAISLKFPGACSVSRLCELYNTYQGPSNLAIQEFLLIELSVTLVPTTVWLFEKATFTVTPEIRGCTLGTVSLVDHPLFKAAALLFEFDEKKGKAGDLTSFRYYSSQLPLNVGKWMNFRALYRTSRYLDSWPAIKELIQHYPHWSTVVKAYENWGPRNADALIQVIPPLIAQEPNNVILRENRRRIALEDRRKLDAQTLDLLREDTEFLIEKYPGYTDRKYSEYRYNVKHLTNRLTSVQGVPDDPLIFEKAIKLIEWYLLSSYENCQKLPPSDDQHYEENEMLTNLMQHIYCSSLSKPCRPLSSDVLNILTACLNKYTAEDHLLEVTLQTLKESYPDIHAQVLARSQGEPASQAQLR